MRENWLARAAKRVVLGVVALGAVSWPLHLLSYRLLDGLGLDLARWWVAVGDFLGLGGPGLRIVAYGALLAFVLTHPAVTRGLAAAGRWLRRRHQRLERRLYRRTALRLRVAGWSALTLVALLLVLQPTRAPLSRPSLGLRIANLVDGTASAALVDGAVGVVYWLTAEPVAMDAAPVTVDDFHATLDDPVVPLMDRWDAELLAAADGDAALAARLKAIMWVESGGRQYAVSSTGCAGLMQFCAGTAQDHRYHRIFGIGQVGTCACRPCEVPREVQIALETDPDAIDEHADAVPCPLTDARFDAERSLAAAAVYVRTLGDEVGGHLLLVYVGYNAGPRVAHRLYERLGEPATVTIDDLRPHLAHALRPTFGSGAEARAAGLLDVHLPKLERAWDRWGPQLTSR